MRDNVIKAARTHLGVSQPEFAQLLGRHPITISKWERGIQLPPDHDLALAEAMLRSKVKRVARLLASRGVIYCLHRILVP